MFFTTPSQLEKVKDKIGTLDVRLQNSFENVKADVGNLYAWIDYLNNMVNHQNSAISSLQGQVDNLPADKDQIRSVIDEYYAAQPLAEKVEKIIERLNRMESSDSGSDVAELRAKVSGLMERYPALLEAIEDFRIRLDSSKKEVFQPSVPRRESIPEPKKSYPRTKLQEKVLRSVARSSKEYVKNMILSMIRKHKNISALQIRGVIVEEQGIASKSSFYRMLEELERDSVIEMMRVGKEKHYFALETPRMV